MDDDPRSFANPDPAASSDRPTSNPTARTLRRSRDDRMLGGVCGGFGEYLGVDANLLRIALVVATILGFGTGVLIYLACWLIIPER